MAKVIKIAIQLLCDGERAPTATEIAAELRAHADAFDGKLKPAKGKGKPAKEDDEDEEEEETESDADADESDEDGDDGDSDDESGEDFEDGDSSDDAEEGGDDADDEDEEDSDGPSKKDCIGLLSKLGSHKKFGVPKAKALLTKVTGQKSIQDVKPAKYAALHKALSAKLKGLGKSK